MRKAFTLLTLSLTLLGTQAPAFADGGHGWRRFPPPAPVYRHEGHREYGGGGWIAPLIFLGAAGAILSASSRPAPPPPAPVAVVPVYPPVAAMPPAPPAQASYYCGSVGQYYPLTSFCPEGWQLVTR